MEWLADFSNLSKFVGNETGGLYINDTDVVFYSTAAVGSMQANIPVKMIPPERSGCCDGNTCHKKEKNKKTENKDCDRTNACNPFAGCSLCHYTAASKYLYAASSVQKPIKKITLSSEAVHSGFTADCWNPPKSVDF